MPCYEYICPESHVTTIYQRPVELRNVCPPCRTCHQQTERAFSTPAVIDCGGIKKSLYRDAGQRMLNSEYGDPQRRKQFFPVGAANG